MVSHIISNKNVVVKGTYWLITVNYQQSLGKQQSKVINFFLNWKNIQDMNKIVFTCLFEAQAYVFIYF